MSGAYLHLAYLIYIKDGLQFSTICVFETGLLPHVLQSAQSVVLIYSYALFFICFSVIRLLLQTPPDETLHQCSLLITSMLLVTWGRAPLAFSTHTPSQSSSFIKYFYPRHLYFVVFIIINSLSRSLTRDLSEAINMVSYCRLYRMVIFYSVLLKLRWTPCLSRQWNPS